MENLWALLSCATLLCIDAVASPGGDTIHEGSGLRCGSWYPHIDCCQAGYCEFLCIPKQKSPDQVVMFCPCFTALCSYKILFRAITCLHLTATVLTKIMCLWLNARGSARQLLSLRTVAVDSFTWTVFLAVKYCVPVFCLKLFRFWCLLWRECAKDRAN